MNLPRRPFLGSSLLAFGSTLTDALTTPLWRWRRGLVLQSMAGSNRLSPVQFVDVAHEAGLNVPVTAASYDFVHPSLASTDPSSQKVLSRGNVASEGLLDTKLIPHVLGDC